ncbi:MAG: hypothetical protein LH610_04445 [Sphingomonas bacterium]|nr:hypothetical protein [Sphingomonas bacterium]
MTVGTTYWDSVMQGGNEKPWTGRPNLSHVDIIAPGDMTLDEAGNILGMPLLRKKPCFGRPETFLRHGARIRRIKNRYGKEIDSSQHQCGSCPELTHASCGIVVKQRVQGDPKIHAALRDWMDDCDTRHHGEKVYVKESGRFWLLFKQAIATRGPFKSSNDRALHQYEVQRAEEQTEKWRKRRARDRARLRKDRQSAAVTVQPTAQFLENALNERDEREVALYAVLGTPGGNKSRSKVLEAGRA